MHDSTADEQRQFSDTVSAPDSEGLSRRGDVTSDRLSRTVLYRREPPCPTPFGTLQAEAKPLGKSGVHWRHERAPTALNAPW